jgi:tRNA(Arg) A34 adenosine deaminase TadA
VTARIEIELPQWVETLAPAGRRLEDDEARMGLVLELARENVARRTGGPFAAAVFETTAGRLVGVGVNLVLPLGSSVLHAEIVALLVAQRAIGRYSLRADDLPAHELVTSCEPCAMCLGATLWSGARRLVAGAHRDDAAAVGFDEGPVFPESYEYLEQRGIETVRGVRRAEARQILERYVRRGGHIYNG